MYILTNNKYIMRINYYRSIAFGFVIIASTILINAQELSGYVYSDSGEPLAGTNIYILNTNTGTSSNPDGYYLLRLKQGRCKVVFSFLGFTSDTLELNVNVGDKITKDIKLKGSILTASEVTVYAGEYNDAELLVLNVLERKHEYLSKLENYTYKAYTKNVLAVEKNDSLVIGGLLETLSEAFCEYPDEFNETIIARKQTKNFNEAMNIFSAGKIPNILAEEIRIDELRIASPLCSNALDYYSFEILDTIYSGNRSIFKLGFSPREDNSPLFDGTVNIVDKTYAPNSVELFGRSRIQGSVKQNVHIRQGFREYENYFWLPVTVETNFELDMGLPGLPPIQFEQTSIISDYTINNSEFNYEFNQVSFSFTPSPDIDTTDIWKKSQVIPLTAKEQNAAYKIDSIMTHGSFLLRATVAVTQSYPVIASLPFTNFSDFYHYNRVEGHYWGIGLDSKNYLGPVNLKLKGGVGSRDELFKYKFSTKIDIAGKKLSLNASYFRDIAYLDSYYDYSMFDITCQALLEDNDYANYYYKKGFSFGFLFRPASEIEFNSSLNIEEHYGKHNIAELTDDEEIIKSTKAMPVAGGTFNHLTFDITYNNLKYIDYGWITEPDISRDYTYIKLNSDFSSPDIFDSDYKFSRFNLYIDKHNKFSRFLNLNLMFLVGIQSGDKPLQNLFHLPGSYGSFGKPNLFRTIRTDDYLGDRYYCVFIQNNFKNNIFKLLQLPWLEDSKIDLIAFFNAGWLRTPSQSTGETSHTDIWETGLGIRNIINFFRLDFSWGKIETNPDFNVTLQSRIEF